MAKTQTKTYPNTTLEKALRERGVPIRLMWEVPGPKDTMVAWLSCYLVNARVVIVQTYKDGNGWQVYTPVEDATITGTVEQVIRSSEVGGDKLALSAPHLLMTCETLLADFTSPNTDERIRTGPHVALLKRAIAKAEGRA